MIFRLNRWSRNFLVSGGLMFGYVFFVFIALVSCDRVYFKDRSTKTLDMELVSDLIERDKVVTDDQLLANINERASDGRTLLMIAAEYGKESLVKRLISLGADLYAACEAGTVFDLVSPDTKIYEILCGALSGVVDSSVEEHSSVEKLGKSIAGESYDSSAEEQSSIEEIEEMSSVEKLRDSITSESYDSSLKKLFDILLLPTDDSSLYNIKQGDVEPEELEQEELEKGELKLGVSSIKDELLDAILKEDIGEIKKILERKSDLDLTERIRLPNSHFYLIHLAIVKRLDASVILKMIESARSTFLIDSEGNSPLDLLAGHPSSSEISKALLEKDSDLLLNVGRYGRSAIQSAVMKGDLELVKSILEFNKDASRDIGNGREEMLNSLHYSIFKGNSQIIEELLGKFDLGTKDSAGRTILHLSSAFGRLDMCELLVGKGMQLTKDYSGLTPVHYIPFYREIKRKHLDCDSSQVTLSMLELGDNRDDAKVMEFFVEKFLVSSLLEKSDSGFTSLHYAMLLNNLDLVKYIVGKIEGIDLSGVDLALDYTPSYYLSTIESISPLGLACYRGHKELVMGLLPELKGRIASVVEGEERDFIDSSTLHSTVLGGSVDICKILIVDNISRKGAKGIYSLRNGDGLTPLDISQLGGYKEIEEILSNYSIMFDPNYTLLEGGEESILDYRDKFGNSSLHIAAFSGGKILSRVKIELDGMELDRKREFVNIKNGLGLTFLHVAAILNSENPLPLKDVLSPLIRDVVDINVEDGLGNRAIHLSILFNQIESFKMLVKSGALILPNNRGDTPIHLLSELLSIDDFKEAISFVVKEGLDIVEELNKKNKEDYSLIQLSANRGRLDQIDYLLQNWLEGIEGKNTLLSIAVDGNHLNIVNYLLDGEFLDGKSLDEGLLDREFHQGDALHVAAKNGNDRVLELLYRKGLKPIRDSIGYLPIHYAVKNRHYSTIRVIRRLNVEEILEGIKDSKKSILELAIINDDTATIDTIHTLCSECFEKGELFYKWYEKINKNRSASEVSNLIHPLHIAAAEGKYSALVFMMSKFVFPSMENKEIISAMRDMKTLVVSTVANNRNDKYRDKMDPFMLSVKHGRREIFDYLAPLSDLESTNYYGCTNLMMASENGDKYMVEFLVNHFKVEGKPEYINTRDDYGRIALHYAVREGHVEVIKSLIPDSNINAEDNKKYTPLIFLVHECKKDKSKDKFDVVKVLEALLEGSDVNEERVNLNAKAKNGYTSLMLAVKKGRVDIVDELLECKGIDIEVRNRKDEGLLLLAKKYSGSDEMVSRIKERFPEPQEHSSKSEEVKRHEEVMQSQVDLGASCAS